MTERLKRYEDDVGLTRVFAYFMSRRLKLTPISQAENSPNPGRAKFQCQGSFLSFACGKEMHGSFHLRFNANLQYLKIIHRVKPCNYGNVM